MLITLDPSPRPSGAPAAMQRGPVQGFIVNPREGLHKGLGICLRTLRAIPQGTSRRFRGKRSGRTTGERGPAALQTAGRQERMARCAAPVSTSFRQAARLRVTGVAPRYPLRPRVVAHATRPAAAC
jgi:hypothetical protein